MEDVNQNITIEDLIDKVKSYNQDEEDIDLINRAFDYAYKKHFGVKRITGDDYISHPLNVAYILTDINADADCLAAALLHDTIEDTDSTFREIRDLFGASVANLVDGVTKINRLHFSNAGEQMAANQRKILVGLSEDVRVIIIKLADRLHNMRTLYVMPEEKQKKKAMVQGKERIRDVSMIVAATTKDYNWTDVTYKTRDFLAACGKGEFEQLTRRKAMEGVEQDIDSWGASLAERPALKKVIQGGGDPSIYMDKDLRTELAHIMEECKGALRLTDEIRKGWPFNTIFYDDERARFYAVDYWAQGYMEYLTAVFDHMDKWDLYYRSEAPGGMMSKPVPLPPPARFLSR